MAWKNILHKPLNTALCVGLLTFGVGIISLLLLIQRQLEQKFERDLRQIDLVVGAKGSPLQLVLSAVYHLDAPTGNIPLADARPIMENPMVDQAIPLAYGDSYRGYRILGTTADYPEKYNADLRAGRLFSRPMEATLGASVAARSGLGTGDTFLGAHGEVKGAHVHEDHPYTVVGILEPTNTVLDNLILTDVASVWEVHGEHEDQKEGDHEEGHHDHEHEEGHHDHEHEEGHHDHEHEEGHHDHEHDGNQDPAPQAVALTAKADSAEITAILLNYKSRMAMLNMPRIINQQTNMQAVLPGLEINRLFHMLGLGATTLKLIAGGIMAMAGFSVFFVLFSRLQERKHELALMRSVGYAPRQLFGLLLLEGLLLAGLGYIAGWLLSRIGLMLVNQRAASDFHLHIGGGWVPGEAWLLLITLAIGVASAMLPAWRAMRTDVSATLSEH